MDNKINSVEVFNKKIVPMYGGTKIEIDAIIHIKQGEDIQGTTDITVTYTIDPANMIASMIMPDTGAEDYWDEVACEFDEYMNYNR